MTGWISIDRKFFIFRKSLAELFPKTSSREVLWRKLDNKILCFFVCEKRWNVNQQIIFRDNEMSLKLISVWGESERVKILKRIPILAKQDAPKIQKQKKTKQEHPRDLSEPMKNKSHFQSIRCWRHDDVGDDSMIRKVVCP